MRERRVTLPELVLISAARGLIGVGAGLLLSERLGRQRRKAVGWTLFATGVASTIPLALRAFRGRAEEEPPRTEEAPPPESEWGEAAIFMAE